MVSCNGSVFVKLGSSSSVSEVDISDLSTVKDIKRVVVGEGSEDQFYVQCNGKVLDANDELDNLEGSQLLIDPRLRGGIQIQIKTLSGNQTSFNFEPETKVKAVKEALQEREGIQIQQIRLIYQGKQLSDDRTLESYNVVAGHTIHMVLSLRGGHAM